MPCSRRGPDSLYTDMNTGIYIHIPFCRQGCTYCHFVTVPFDAALVDIYVRGVIREMELFAASCGQAMAVDSVYIGGGTPSLLPADLLGKILDACRDTFSLRENCEISMEANPNTLSRNAVGICRDAGVNRVSLGVQSLHERELRALGRVHTARDVSEAVQLLQRGGVPNINLDVMLGLPYQTPESWRNTLSGVQDLDVPHLSVYMLDLDEPCALSGAIAEGSIHIPDDDCIAGMYSETINTLLSYGYRQYEISNFARHGLVCRHNLKYWRCNPVIGFGLASHSFDGNSRYANFQRMKQYLHALESGRLPIDWRRTLDAGEKLEERLFLGLRMNEGIEWSQLHNAYPEECLQTCEKALRDPGLEGLVQWAGSAVRLTTRGMLLSNEIFQLFV